MNYIELHIHAFIMEISRNNTSRKDMPLQSPKTELDVGDQHAFQSNMENFPANMCRFGGGSCKCAETPASRMGRVSSEIVLGNTLRLYNRDA